MSRKTQGKGISQGMPPELLRKEGDGQPVPAPGPDPRRARAPHYQTGLPRPRRPKRDTGEPEGTPRNEA